MPPVAWSHTIAYGNSMLHPPDGSRAAGVSGIDSDTLSFDRDDQLTVIPLPRISSPQGCVPSGGWASLLIAKGIPRKTFPAHKTTQFKRLAHPAIPHLLSAWGL
jgi:hypothetical protein